MTESRRTEPTHPQPTRPADNRPPKGDPPPKRESRPKKRARTRPTRLCRTVDEIRAAAAKDAQQHADLTDREIDRVLALIAPYRDEITRSCAA